MFNNTNVKFSNTAQVMRTVEHLKRNKTSLVTQYPLAFKVKVVDLMLSEMHLAKQGKTTFLGKSGKFSRRAFYKSCGLGTTPYGNKWETVYDALDGNTNIDYNTYSVSRHGLEKLHKEAENKALGSLARESSAVNRRLKELELKEDAAQIGFKLVKVG